ncbi:MAG: hypothetical protein V4489_00330 [Chlamydiota bacterium]
MDKKKKMPSVYTSIYWLIQDGKIEPEMLFKFSEFYWPTFIKKDNCIFLKEKFSEEQYDQLVNENHNPEYWINLLMLDDFFSKLEDGDNKSSSLAKILVEIWQAKLQKEFPAITFTVECLQDEECGDCGLTFYQKK